VGHYLILPFLGAKVPTDFSLFSVSNFLCDPLNITYHQGLD